MAARTTLFRLFLASILMLNGVASAVAAVQHVAGSGVPTATSEAAKIDPVAGGAHDGCGDMAPGLVESDAPITIGAHGTGLAPSPDCCEPGTCQGKCANTVVPVLAAVMHNCFQPPGQAASPPTASWHAAPSLPHLMRPPIA